MLEEKKNLSSVFFLFMRNLINFALTKFRRQNVELRSNTYMWHWKFILFYFLFCKNDISDFKVQASKRREKEQND